MPASGGAPAAGLEGQTNQEEAEGSEEDEARAAESGGGAPLTTSEVWGGAPAGIAASKKLERLGNKHGVELDDRLAELLRYGAVPCFFGLFVLVLSLSLCRIFDGVVAQACFCAPFCARGRFAYSDEPVVVLASCLMAWLP